MKKWISVLATALMAFAFTSCFNLDDGSKFIPEYWCMATVTTGGVNPVFQMDEGFYLTPDKAQPADTFAVGERYYLYFIIGDTINHSANTYPIQLFRYGKTTIKALEVLPKDSTDRWGKMPIVFSDLWYSGHYCNFYFRSFQGDGTPNTFELIRIKENELTTPTDTVPKLFFELRHNVAANNSSVLYNRFYSFDLSSLTTDFPNAVRFNIKISWSEMGNGTYTSTNTYIPNQILTRASLVSANRKQATALPTSF